MDRAPKKDRRPPAWLLALNVCYLALVTGLLILNRLGADLCWPGALNLYLPQALWALPGIVLATCLLKKARHWTWLPLLGVAAVAGPLMGFCPPWRGTLEAPGLPLRVMTWNVKYDSRDRLAQLALRQEIERNSPAVVLLQDAGGVLDGPLGAYFSGWHVRCYGQYLIASRLPLGEPRILRIAIPGDEQSCLRTEVRIGPMTLALYDVHFETPRPGLNALRGVRRNPGFLPVALWQFENNVEARLNQVRTLREYLREERGPVIVAGDLNSPDASRVCATLRDAGLHDAFAEAGSGYGYTYGHFLLRDLLPACNLSWMRIDHIMTSPQLQTRACWTGTRRVSAHRPVIADLSLGLGPKGGIGFLSAPDSRR